MTLNVAQALGHLPQGLRDELVAEHGKITPNYREARWEAAELDGGRFCEIVYTIFAAYLNGEGYPQRASKPTDLKSACEDLGKVPKSAGPDSARVTIPRVLVALYQVRNVRGVAHVGGVVDANHMDATFVLHTAQWVMAELVRMFHDTDVTTATDIVDALVDRTVPVVWRVGDATRVLDAGMSLSDQTLVLLYSEPQGLYDRVLARNLEQRRLDNYRRVLSRLHDRRIVEYNQDSGLVVISPVGTNDVEGRLLK